MVLILKRYIKKIKGTKTRDGHLCNFHGTIQMYFCSYKMYLLETDNENGSNQATRRGRGLQKMCC